MEDNRSFRSKLANYLNEAPGFNCVCACDSAEEAIKVVPKLLPDVVLMDIHLPSMSGVDLCHFRRLKDLCPALRCGYFILTVYEDNDRIFGALKAGASGYLLKRAEPADILRAIQEVKAGGAPMSSQIACRVVQSFPRTGLAGSRSRMKRKTFAARDGKILPGELSKGYSSKGEISEHFSISVTTHGQYTSATHLRKTSRPLPHRGCCLKNSSSSRQAVARLISEDQLQWHVAPAWRCPGSAIQIE